MPQSTDHEIPVIPYYRLGVGLMILNSENKIFTGKRIDLLSHQDHYAWQMPQGGIDQDETPYKAALREMKEEIGTTDVILLAQSTKWYSYKLPKELSKNLWGGRYDGQTQKWFLFRFKGQDSHIDIQTRHPEFSQWKWMNPEDVLNVIVPFKKDVYQHVFNEFHSFF